MGGEIKSQKAPFWAYSTRTVYRPYSDSAFVFHLLLPPFIWGEVARKVSEGLKQVLMERQIAWWCS